MTLPRAQVSANAAGSLRLGYPWVYRQEVVAPPADAAPGDVVEVAEVTGARLGQALWADASPIALRLVTRQPPDEVAVDDAFFVRRVEAAWARRRSLHGRDAFRVVHGEADLLPGVFLDRYGDVLGLQVLAQGMERRKGLLALAARRVAGARLVVSRDDGSGRDFEGLPRTQGVLLGEGSTWATYHEGSSTFRLDVAADAKTGGFLDQVDNHLRAGALAEGARALDTFSYHGGFALALARTCGSVLAVEQDARAAQRAFDNARDNGLSHVTVQTANAFDVLHAAADARERFDVVVVDPPGLAKRREGLATALRAYKELNLRALQCLGPEGLLVTCSCSGKVSREQFDAVVLEAARDARKVVQVLERRGAGLDHPALGGLKETEYLKVTFLRVLGER